MDHQHAELHEFGQRRFMIISVGMRETFDQGSDGSDHLQACRRQISWTVERCRRQYCPKRACSPGNDMAGRELSFIGCIGASKAIQWHGGLMTRDHCSIFQSNLMKSHQWVKSSSRYSESFHESAQMDLICHHPQVTAKPRGFLLTFGIGRPRCHTRFMWQNPLQFYVWLQSKLSERQAYPTIADEALCIEAPMSTIVLEGKTPANTALKGARCSNRTSITRLNAKQTAPMLQQVLSHDKSPVGMQL